MPGRVCEFSDNDLNSVDRVRARSEDVEPVARSAGSWLMLMADARFLDADSCPAGGGEL